MENQEQPPIQNQIQPEPLASVARETEITPPQTPAESITEQDLNNNSRTQNIIAIFLLIFFYLIGLIYMYKVTKWPKWLKFILTLPLILAILGIILATALASINSFHKPQQTSNLLVQVKPSVPILTPTSNATDETANWKTYANTTYGYTFKYPTPQSEKTDKLVSTPVHQIELYYSNFNITFYVPHTGGPNSADVGLDSQPQWITQNDMKIPNTKIAGVAVSRREGTMNGKPSIRIAIPINDIWVMEVWASALGDTNSKTLKTQVDQILSTFKFTDQTSSGGETATAPENIINSLYQSYLTCINNHFQSNSNKSPREDCPFNNYPSISPDLLTKLDAATFADPILCAQNVPESIKVDQATISGDTATATVHTFYGGSGDNPIKVSLEKQNNQWLISDITCNH